jgi:hypothetical protein
MQPVGFDHMRTGNCTWQKAERAQTSTIPQIHVFVNTRQYAALILEIDITFSRTTGRIPPRFPGAPGIDHWYFCFIIQLFYLSQFIHVHSWSRPTTHDTAYRARGVKAI